jgi:hypothetical protein
MAFTAGDDDHERRHPIGIIYLAKDDNYGFNAEDEQILEPMIVQAGLNLAIAATDDHNGRTN